MELNQELLRALELAAWDPNHALGRVEAWPAGEARPSPPATPEQVQASQRRLGFSLPVPLRQVVMQVANGGFGPGYGLLGLEGGATDDKGRTAVDTYLLWSSWHGQQGWRWPQRLLPICSWGCAIYTCMICEQGSVGGRLVRFDPNIEDELQRFSGEGRTFAQWLRAWLDGQDLWPLEASEADEEAELGWWQQRLGPPWARSPVSMTGCGRCGTDVRTTCARPYATRRAERPRSFTVWWVCHLMPQCSSSRSR